MTTSSWRSSRGSRSSTSPGHDSASTPSSAPCASSTASGSGSTPRGTPDRCCSRDIWNAQTLSEIKLALDDDGGESAEAVVLHHLGLEDERVEHLRVQELDRVVPDHLTCVYLPALRAPVGRELAALESVVAELRERCPWDRKQTHHSLTRHLIEECYETIEAIDHLGDPPDPGASAALEEELGDVLCQVMFHAQLAKEEGLFELADVARTVREKLVHRHPHVFGGREGVTTVEAVLSQWEELKRQEKGRTSLMDGIPAALPALLLATKLERKATGVGLGAAVTGGATGLPPEVESALVGDADTLGEALCSLARAGGRRRRRRRSRLPGGGRALPGALPGGRAFGGRRRFDVGGCLRGGPTALLRRGRARSAWSGGLLPRLITLFTPATPVTGRRQGET